MKTTCDSWNLSKNIYFYTVVDKEPKLLISSDFDVTISEAYIKLLKKFTKVIYYSLTLFMDGAQIFVFGVYLIGSDTNLLLNPFLILIKFDSNRYRRSKPISILIK